MGYFWIFIEEGPSAILLGGILLGVWLSLFVLKFTSDFEIRRRTK